MLTLNRLRAHAIVLHDAAMAGLSLWLAFYLRLGEALYPYLGGLLIPAMALFMGVTVAVSLWLRLPRRMWRYVAMQDLMDVIKAASLSVLIFYLILFQATRLELIHRSVPVIHWLVLMVLWCGPRVALRAMKEGQLKLERAPAKQSAVPVLLVGADDQADIFIRESERDAHFPYRAVAIVDPEGSGPVRRIRQVPVYAALDVLPAVVRKLERKGMRPQRIVVARRQTDGAMLKQLLEQSDALGISLARLPHLSELRRGDGQEVRLDIRPIDVEDVLGRPQNLLDREAMRALVAGRKVLVTGAGGSIGSELVRQLAQLGPRELVLLDASEFSLYQIDLELSENWADGKWQSVLGDVRDKAHIDRLMAQEKPEIVFHSAAIKHVPLAQINAEETVLTNIIGTRNVGEAAALNGARAVVLISTDKAVNPSNVMGASKRAAEMVCQLLGEQHPSTRFVTVRFGNVLGSTGSVVPLFERQLKRGGPLTVTHPDMTRYFMTIREAVELVIQAAALSDQEAAAAARIYVLEMGEPVRIEELAKQMIRLAGLRPNVDIHLSYTGLRPGEKLQEELFYAQETLLPTPHGKIHLAQPQAISKDWLQSRLDALHLAALARSPGKTLALLGEIVPSFRNLTSEHAA